MDVNAIGKTSFGWNRTTHLEMTMLALKDIDMEPKDKRQLARFSQMPDFIKSELGFHNDTHFFFPDSNRSSFGFNRKENAFFQYKKHIVNAMSPLNKEDFLRNTGYALHYLQDVSMPMHTERSGLLAKIRDYYLHKNFEAGKKLGATAHIEELKTGSIPNRIETQSVRRIFLDTARYSSQFKVSRFNKKDWLKIQQDCFNLGVDATRAFVTSIIKKVNF